jgi:hypothetical protein
VLDEPGDLVVIVGQAEIELQNRFAKTAFIEYFPIQV